MKKIHLILGTVVLAGSLSACSSAYFASASYASDDLYATHDRRQIALEKQAQAEARKAEAEARKAEWEALIAEAEAAASENRYYEYKADVNPYDAVLADDYESAYARRLRGFESPTYRMPSSYINARYSSEFNYVSAYDPAFYNIVISGDQIWVEPKYITSMFGTWGGTVICADPWYYGWTRPWNWGWGWSWSTWYNPWYYSSWYNPWWAWNWSWNWGWSWSWNWGWGPGWYGGPGWHGHPHWGAPGPARPRYSNLVRRPDPYRSPSGTHYRSGTRYMNATAETPEAARTATTATTASGTTTATTPEATVSTGATVRRSTAAAARLRSAGHEAAAPVPGLREAVRAMPAAVDIRQAKL